MESASLLFFSDLHVSTNFLKNLRVVIFGAVRWIMQNYFLTEHHHLHKMCVFNMMALLSFWEGGGGS